MPRVSLGYLKSPSEVEIYTHAYMHTLYIHKWIIQKFLPLVLIANYKHKKSQIKHKDPLKNKQPKNLEYFAQFKFEKKHTVHAREINTGKVAEPYTKRKKRGGGGVRRIILYIAKFKRSLHKLS